MKEGVLIFGFTASRSFKNGMIIYANRQFGELVKRPTPNVIGSSIFDFVTEKDVKILQVMVGEVKNGRTVTEQIHLKKDDGTLAYVNFSIGSILRKAVTYAIVTDLTKIKKSDQERLASELLKAQHDERKRIAGELHDNLAGELSAIRIALENKLNSMRTHKRSKIKMEDVITQLQTNIEVLHRIMKDLHPAILDDLGLNATISWYCRDFQITYPHIHVESKVSVPEDEISSSLKETILQICQEVFRNIAEHSRSNFVTLYLKKHDGKIELAIMECCIGLNLKDVEQRGDRVKGFALGDMKKRAELLGGTFSITSHPGTGTMIRASWPI